MIFVFNFVEELEGGNLRLINAADKSIEWGYEGAVHGFATNEELLKVYHYEWDET